MILSEAVAGPRVAKPDGSVVMPAARGLFLLFSLMLFTPQVAAHQLKSVAMNLDVVSGELVQVSFKSPLGVDGRPASVVPVATPACEIHGDTRSLRNASRLVRYWDWHCPGGLSGREVGFEGLNAAAPEGILTVRFADGTEAVHLLDRYRPGVTLGPESATATAGALQLAAYLPIGMEHILLGPDHLLFVLCLLLILRFRRAGLRRLLLTITAFTLAHSFTLGLSVLWGWTLPATPVEAAIALSILLLAVELAKRYKDAGYDSLTFRFPEGVAFAFGLLHGFGFAGALAEIGLPAGMRGWALLLFNLGVEAGQLLFVAGVLLLMAITRSARRPLPSVTAPAAITLVGALSAFWFIDRLWPVIAI